MGISFPYNLANGTTADAGEVMSNLNEIKNNFDQDTIEDASANSTEFRATKLPDTGSLPTSGREELKVLRYQILKLMQLLNPAITTWDEAFPKLFTSAEQTIIAAGPLTLPHGLSSSPGLIQCRLICKTTELGYSVDDELIIGAMGNGGGSANTGHAVIPDSTNLNIRFGAAGYSIPHKTTGVETGITPAKWKLIVKAWG